MAGENRRDAANKNYIGGIRFKTAENPEMRYKND
jgi:hypothetical protein